MNGTGLSFQYWVASAFRSLLYQLGRFGLFLFGLFLALLAAGMLGSAVMNAYDWLQVVFLSVFLVVDLYLISVLFDQGLRRRAFLWLIRDGTVGWQYPIVATTLMFFLLAIAVFSTAAVVFQERGWVSLLEPSCAPPCRLTTGDLTNFYIWHLLEAVPLLQVNTTLHWDEPLVYRGALAGWLVLGFKVAVILPMIQAFRIYWKLRSVTPNLRLRAWPRVAPLGSTIKISWSSAPPPDGYAFDVHVKEPPLDDGDSGEPLAARDASPTGSGDADAEAWRALVRELLGKGWMPWLRGQTATSSEYRLKRPGVYRFQAWWRDIATGQTSNTPRAVSVRARSATRDSDSA